MKGGDIMGDTGKDGVITLGGREFKRAKNGVDEAEIGAFVDELIRERDELAKSQHHIASLTKLAENTIVEADRMANQIKADASEQAKAESAAIIDKAKQEAQQMAEEKQAEALEAGNREAEAIRSEARKEAATLLGNEKKKIWDELHSVVNQQFDYLIEKLESLKQQAAAAQADFKNNMSEPMQESSAATVESEVEKDAAPVGAREESAAATTAKEQAGDSATTGKREESDSAAPEERNTFYESLAPTQVSDQSTESFDLSRFFEMEDRAEQGEAQFEVEILPPVQMAKIMEVVASLDQLPEVGNTEIIPRMDTPSILVFLRRELNLVDALRTMPAVAHVEEATTDTDATNGEPARAPKKIRIGLSGNTMSQERK
jgi:cell division septum initiation protein DivIVA